MSVLPTVRQTLQGLNQIKSPKFLRFDQVLACWLIALALLLEGAINPVVSNDLTLVYEVPIAPIPVVSNFENLPNLSAQSFMAVDLNSAVTLAASNSSQLNYPASVLKLLTALTVLNKMSETDKIQILETDLQSFPGVKNELLWQAGEFVTVKDLIASLLINSDNLSALVLADHFPGGAGELNHQMELLAKDLHLSSQLKISNPIGLDAPDQLLSSRDLIILAKAALENSLIKNLVASKELKITTQISNLPLSHKLANTNELLFSEPIVLGVKTGTTQLAGEVLVTLALINDQPVLTVVMGSQNRYQDTRLLLNWLKLHYRWQSWTDIAYNETSE